MRKGITPIIAIVILLLIVVGIAGAAFTFLTGFSTGLTSKNLEITSTICSADIVRMFVRNIGQDNIDLTSDVTVTRTEIANAGGGADTPTIQETGSPIAPGAGGEINDSGTGCNEGGTCEYAVEVGGRVQTIRITCQ